LNFEQGYNNDKLRITNYEWWIRLRRFGLRHDRNRLRARRKEFVLEGEDHKQKEILNIFKLHEILMLSLVYCSRCNKLEK
jgi:hypothetical protein